MVSMCFTLKPAAAPVQRTFASHSSHTLSSVADPASSSDIPATAFARGEYLILASFRMATAGIPEEVLRNEQLIQKLEEIAKDAALMSGILMRTKETPNGSEVCLAIPPNHVWFL